MSAEVLTGRARVVIVDDHPVMRAGVRAYLTEAQNFEIVAEADNGQTALQLCEQHRPDLLLLDLNIPQVPGIEVIKRLREKGSPTKILVLSAYDDTDYVYQLLKAGANGYIYKGNMGNKLVEAVQNVLSGENWLSPHLATRLFFHSNQQSSQPRLEELLTKREIEILTMIASGLENDEIAEKLFLSKNTIQNHTSTIYSKINVRTRAKAIVYAIKHRLVELETLKLDADE